MSSSASWCTGTAPGAIRGNVLWLDSGDKKFPGLRKKEDWNRLQITAKGPQITVRLNGKQICDVKDDPTDPAEARWKEAGPISLQWPPAGESGWGAGVHQVPQYAHPCALTLRATLVFQSQLQMWWLVGSQSAL